MSVGQQIVIEFGIDEQGYWHWRCGEVEGGPYRTVEDAERAAKSVLLPPGCKVNELGREWLPGKSIH